MKSPVRILASRERSGKSEPRALKLQLNITIKTRMPKDDLMSSIRVSQVILRRGDAIKETKANPISTAKTVLPNARAGIEAPTKMAKAIE